MYNGKNLRNLHVNLVVILFNALRHLWFSYYALENRGIHCLDNHVLDLTVDAF